MALRRLGFAAFPVLLIIVGMLSTGCVASGERSESVDVSDASSVISNVNPIDPTPVSPTLSPDAFDATGSVAGQMWWMREVRRSS